MQYYKLFNSFKREAVFFGFISFFILWLFSNYLGYEGDDLNTVLPIIHLQDAKDGRLIIYRYHWQPLTYEIGSFVYKLTKNVNAIFLLPQIFIALSISILYYCCTYILEFNRKLFIPLLMLFPEIIYSGLYFNSTAIAFPLVCACILLALKYKTWHGALLTGICLSLAVMIRFDFILIAPFIFVFRHLFTKNISDLILVGLCFCLGLTLGILSGLLVPEKIFAVYDLARQEIIQRSSEPGWDLRLKLFVATTILSPVGWLVLAIAFYWSSRNARFWKPVLLGLFSLIPMILSARNILTPKYMMPLLAIAPVLVVIFWNKSVFYWDEKSRNKVALIWIIVTIGLLIFSIEPTKKIPYIKISMNNNEQIGTHDGARSWGSYFWQLKRVSSVENKDSQEADRLIALFKTPASLNTVFVGNQNFFSTGGVAWRHLQLRFEREGFHGRVTQKGRVEFVVPHGKVILSSTENFENDVCKVPLEKISKQSQTPIEWISRNCKLQ